MSVKTPQKESARAKMRVIVKHLLRRYGYPPDMQALATETVLQQAELLAEFEVGGSNGARQTFWIYDKADRERQREKEGNAKQSTYKHTDKSAKISR